MLESENQSSKVVSGRAIPNQNKPKDKYLSSFLFNKSIFTFLRTRGRKKQNSLGSNELAINKEVNVQSYNQPTSSNNIVHTFQQQGISYPTFISTTPSYGTITNNDINQSYGGYLPQAQLNPAFINSHPCYKCNNIFWTKYNETRGHYFRIVSNVIFPADILSSSCEDCSRERDHRKLDSFAFWMTLWFGMDCEKVSLARSSQGDGFYRVTPRVWYWLHIYPTWDKCVNIFLSDLLLQILPGLQPERSPFR